MKNPNKTGFLTVLRHPIEGFDLLTQKKQGSPKLSLAFILAFFFVTLFERHMLNFRFNHYSVENTNVFLVFISTFGMAVIAVLANWALSTLWDGKASLRTVWIVTGYSLFPYICGVLLKTALSHVLNLEEGVFLSMLTAAFTLWSLVLFWFGMLHTQEYTVRKNLLCLLGTAVGMILILFLIFLIILLFGELFAFLKSVYNELHLFIFG